MIVETCVINHPLTVLHWQSSCALLHVIWLQSWLSLKWSFRKKWSANRMMEIRRIRTKMGRGEMDETKLSIEKGINSKVDSLRASLEKAIQDNPTALLTQQAAPRPHSLWSCTFGDLCRIPRIWENWCCLNNKVWPRCVYHSGRTASRWKWGTNLQSEPTDISRPAKQRWWSLREWGKEEKVPGSWR